MSAEFKVVKVGDVEYVVSLCSAIVQRKIQFKLIKYGLFDAIPSLLSGNTHMAGAVILAKFADRAPEEDMLWMFDTLLDEVVIKGDKDTKTLTVEDFHNRMYEYDLLALEALKANFEDFSQLLISKKENQESQKETQ